MINGGLLALPTRVVHGIFNEGVISVSGSTSIRANKAIKVINIKTMHNLMIKVNLRRLQPRRPAGDERLRCSRRQRGSLSEALQHTRRKFRRLRAQLYLQSKQHK